jgi:hypothetical protein
MQIPDARMSLVYECLVPERPKHSTDTTKRASEFFNKLWERGNALNVL